MIDQLKKLIDKWEDFGDGPPWGGATDYDCGFGNGRMRQASECAEELAAIVHEVEKRNQKNENN